MIMLMTVYNERRRRPTRLKYWAREGLEYSHRWRGLFWETPNLLLKGLPLLFNPATGELKRLEPMPRSVFPFWAQIAQDIAA